MLNKELNQKKRFKNHRKRQVERSLLEGTAPQKRDIRKAPAEIAKKKTHSKDKITSIWNHNRKSLTFLTIKKQH